MNASKEKYKKLYVLSPEYYKKLQKQQTKIVPDHPLDEMLIKIMKSRQPNMHKKWLMYKNALISFRESKDKNTLKVPHANSDLKTKNLEFNTPHFKDILKKDPSYYWDSEFYNDQTPLTSKPRKSVKFSSIPNTSDMFSKYRQQNVNDTLNSSSESVLEDNNLSNDQIKNIFDSTRNPELEDLFEYNPNNSTENTSIPNDEVEQELFQIAKETLGENNEENVVRLDNTLNDSFRVFENQKTRDLIAIQVEPVAEFVKKDVPISFTKEIEPRTDVGRVVQNIDEYTSREHQPTLIRLAQAPIEKSNSKKSTLRRRSLHLRNRRIEGKRSSSPRMRHKQIKTLHQPQKGKGYNKFTWSTLTQKKI